MTFSKDTKPCLLTAMEDALGEDGMPSRAILRRIANNMKKDLTFESGRILSSMCTKPHRFAIQVYCKYFEKNLGDPGLFPGAAKIENEVVRMLGSLLSNPHANGFVVSGGTEANILAVWAARNLSKVDRPEVVLPLTSHFSFDRAADLLRVKLVKARIHQDNRVDIDEVKKAITKETILLVGVAGTTDLGSVDPVSEMSELAEAYGIPLHVDASFGGFVLPFLKELGYEAPDFDFRLRGVSSVTIDPHKMGMAPIPAGGILFRERKFMKAISSRVSYLSGGPTLQSTLLSTRPGAAAIASWALLKMMGKKGFKKIVKQCMDLTHFLYHKTLDMQGVQPLLPPTLNVLGITTRTVELPQLAHGLRQKGWALSLYPSHIRIVLMPHLRRSHLQYFLKDLQEIVMKMY